MNYLSRQKKIKTMCECDQLAHAAHDHYECEAFARVENLERLQEALAALKAEGRFLVYAGFEDYAQKRFGLPPELVSAILQWRKR